MVIAAAGLGCADDEVPESDSKTIADGEDEGAEGSEAGGRTDPECGDGEVSPGEDCDDGNATDDDQCTNACTLPSCGDGIVQADGGEACDDGNLEPGDGCSSRCALRGTELANHTSAWFTFGNAVVIDSNDQITVLGRANGQSWIAKFDEQFDTVWDVSALPGNPPGLAIGPEDELLIAGRVGDQARTKRLNPNNGTDLWLDGVPYVASAFSSVAAAGHHMVAAGYFGEMFHEQGVLARHDPATGMVLSRIDWAHGPFGPVAVDAAGWVWVIDGDKESQLRIYDAQDLLDRESGLAAGVYVDIAVDQDRNVYLLSHSLGKQSYRLWKYLPDGTTAWPPVKIVDASASGLVLAPHGVVIVAGHTSDESHGLLAWFDGASGALLHELEVGTDGEPGIFEVFQDIAVAPSGEFAVAVGGRGLAPNNTALWVYKFEI